MRRTRRKIKPAIRFKAALPVMLSEQGIDKRCSYKHWLTLAPDNRRMYRNIGGKGNTYYEIIKLAPYDNLAILALKKRLAARRVIYYERQEEREGVPFLIITTTYEEELKL